MNATQAAGGSGVRQTFGESPLAAKTVLAGVLINRLGGFLNIFLVLFMASRDYSTAQAAIALSAYGAGAIAGVLAGGALANWLGARNATVISMAASSVLTVALLYLPSYWLLIATIVVIGAASQLHRPASATLLSALTPQDRQVMIFAMYRFCLNLGATAAPLVGFALYNLDRQQYGLLFWAEGLVALAYAALAFVALPARVPRDRSRSQHEDAPSGGYLAVLRDRRYRLYLVATFFHAAVYVQYLSTLPLDITAAGIGIVWYTVAVSLNGLMVIVFELPLTKVTQRWPLRVTIGLAFALLAAGVAFYGLPPAPAVIIAATLIWSLGEVLGAPAVFAYPAVVAQDHLRGHYIGSFQFMFALGSAIGPMVGGWLFVRLGHQVWPVLACGSVIATACGLAAVRGAPRPAGAAPGPRRAPRPTTATTGFSEHA